MKLCNNIRLYDLIVFTAKAGLSLQASDGSFPPGHNGPYRDPETPVRNTAHWLMTLCKAYEISGKALFRESALSAGQYLLSIAARPMAASFFCRNKPGKDFCNGLIGQAWAIESLAYAAKIFDESDFHSLALDVFQSHPFDENLGLWRIVNVDGSWSNFDITFNHQLWFAASGLSLETERAGSVQKKVEKFLEVARAHHFRSSRHGLIFHDIVLPKKNRRSIRLFYLLLYLFKRYLNSREMTHKEIGYQSFNLYGFSILKKAFPENPLWLSPAMVRAINFIYKDQYLRGIENNRFGYGYNPAGLEIAYTQQVFIKAEHKRERNDSWWVIQQLSRTYDNIACMMNRKTEDPVTLSARFYEAIRLSDIKIQLS